MCIRDSLWALAKGIKPSGYTRLFDQAYWESLSDGVLTIGQLPEQQNTKPLHAERAAELHSHTHTHGFFADLSGTELWEASPRIDLGAITVMLHKLITAGWPPSFIFVYDEPWRMLCLLYTSDAADDLLCVDLGGRRILNKKNHLVIA
eukprot:TRINITY_DN9058_c0_g1_i1.p1 TRINITY_DN9058_c0_g1~~TRINITY_DN9058_c0_g1_i1.p1  ORF type:complete len:148 (+),score=34.81 TRINITY_DN9058_c0_g1_i1:134-577(+)